jgi:hypothetical protein
MTERAIFNRQDVLDLVKSFSGSGDLRLRANGIQALAMMAAGREQELAAMAEPELIDAIASAPLSSDVETMNRFRDRVVAALRELGPDRIKRILERLSEKHIATKDRARRTSLGWLLIRAIGSGMPLQTSWFGLRRLVRSTGAVSILRVLGLCLVAVALAACVVFGLLAATGLEFAEKDDASALLLIGWLLVSILIYLTPIGRLELPTGVRAVEVAIWAIVFAILSLGAAGLSMRSEFEATPLAAIVVMGGLVGACIRLYCWESQADWPWDTLGAIAIATIGCMAVGYLINESKLAGASWMALAPAGAIAAALSHWMETKGPDVRPKSRRSTLVARFLILIAGAVILFVGGKHALASIGRFSTWPVPAESLESHPFDRDSTTPRTIELSLKADGSYVIEVRPKDDQIDVCFVVTKEGQNSGTTVNERAKGEREESTLKLPAGKNQIEVATTSSKLCDPGATKPNLVDHATEFLAGAEAKPSVRIKITAAKMPADPSPATPSPSTPSPSTPSPSTPSPSK